MSAIERTCRRVASVRLLVFVAALSPAIACGDTRAELAAMVGHSKAELIQRFGYPSDVVKTVDGEFLTYDSIDAGRVDGRDGQRTRAGWEDDARPYARSYSFRCTTHVVIRNGTVQAFNRNGNDCH